MRTASISGQGVFTRSVMARVADVASPIPRFISMEVIETLRPALRQRSNVPVVRIIAIVYVAVKAARAMKPATSPIKHSAYKPIGTVIAIRSTVIRRVVEVAIGTYGSRSDVYADRNLGWGDGCSP